MPLAGAPRDLYMQLLACSSLQSVVAIACCLRAILCFGLSFSLIYCHSKEFQWLGLILIMTFVTCIIIIRSANLSCCTFHHLCLIKTDSPK